VNLSPYDGAIFSGNISSLALGTLESAEDPDRKDRWLGYSHLLVATGRLGNGSEGRGWDYGRSRVGCHQRRPRGSCT